MMKVSEKRYGGIGYIRVYRAKGGHLYRAKGGHICRARGVIYTERMGVLVV